MNILVLSHRVPFPPNKGEKIRTFHQVQFLVAQGHDVTVLSPYEDEEERDYARDLEKCLAISVSMFPLKLKWLRLLRGLAQNLPLTVAFFYNRELQATFDQLISSGKYGAVLCSSSAMASYVFHNKKLAGPGSTSKVKLVMDFMDLDSDKWQQYQAQSGLPMKLVYRREAKLVNRLEKSCYELFDTCFFVSDKEAELFAHQLPESGKVRVMGNGIDTDLFYPDSTKQVSDHPVMLFTGVMNYKPNEDAVEWFVSSVWPDILTQWPDAEFIIGGMNPSQKVQQLGKKQGVTVTGFVEDIVPYYQKAHVFVAPFRLARGLQNKILQALACGLPVITTELGLEGIKAEVNEEILVAGSAPEFEAQVKRLLTDKQLYAKLSQKGPRLIHRDHSWNSLLNELAAALKERDFE